MKNNYSAFLLSLILLCAFGLGFFLKPVQSHEALPSGWTGEYYANPALLGKASVVAGDEVIDMNWSTASPYAEIPLDYFSVRWTRLVELSAGVYRFRIGADDRSRLFIDGKLFLEAQENGNFQTSTREIYLPAGLYELEVQYVETTGRAGILVEWGAVSAEGQPVTLEQLPSRSRPEIWARVQLPRVNLYAESSTDAAFVRQAYANQSYKVMTISPDGAWYYLQLGPSQFAWAPAHSLRLEGF